MKTKVLIYCFALFAFTLSCKEETQNELTKSEIKIVSPEEIDSLLELEDVQLVDVRTPEEYKEGFIKHSQNIDFRSSTFDEDIVKLDKTKPVIVYCKSGKRSAQCSKKLKEAGFVKIYDLKGGITQWKFKGYEIETYQ
ncbi:rhodanese-like domain-containing protein [uncultured Psychroserpens sp.]|uniref:rhodanese-like domain-containing protein n=1 Tax=uncultured Psychroserpens sp. TaxID=255436 RepID=UPI00261100C4|nr:rhodanese-like domain-containing protein [uncultured Psychroserpens sp.]